MGRGKPLLFLARSGLPIVLGERQAGPFTSLCTCCRLRWVSLPNHLPTSVFVQDHKDPILGKAVTVSFSHCTVPLLPLLTNSPDGDKQSVQGHGQNEVEGMPKTSRVGRGERVECSRAIRVWRGGWDYWAGGDSRRGHRGRAKHSRRETTAGPATPAALREVTTESLWGAVRERS